MGDLNINQGSGANVFFDGTQDPTDISKQTSQSAKFADGQAQAVDVSLLTIGGSEKIPLNPILPTDPKNLFSSYTKDFTEVATDTVKDSNTTVAVASDGSLVKKGSGQTSNPGFLSLQGQADLTKYQDVTDAATTIANLLPKGAKDSVDENAQSDTKKEQNKSTTDSAINTEPKSAASVSSSSTNTLMGFLKTIQDAIDKLQDQLRLAQMGINQMDNLDNGYKADPSVTAYLAAAKANPKMADLMLLRAQLEYAKADHVSTIGSTVPIDITKYAGIVNALKQNGINPPTGSWSSVSVADLTKLITDVDAQVTSKAQSMGVLGKTLEDVLGVSIVGFLPMVQRGLPVCDMLHTSNALLIAGFTGTNPAKDQAILKAHPDIVKALYTWGALPHGVNSLPDVENVLNLLNRAAVVNAETTRVTTNDLLYIRAPGGYDLEMKEAQDFLNLMKPVNEQINNLMGGDVSGILGTSTLSSEAKQQVQDVISGILAQGLLASSTNMHNSLAKTIEEAMAGLALSSTINRLERVFEEKAPDALLDASTAPRHRAFEGARHTRNLSKEEGELFNIIDKFARFESGTLKSGRGLYNFDPEVMGNSNSWLGAAWNELHNPKLMAALENLPNIDATHVPEIYDFLRARPWLQDKFPYCKELVKNEPMVLYSPKKLPDNVDDKRPDNQEQVEMIEEAIKMLQKILANLQGGTVTLDLSSLKSTLSESMGLSNATASNQFLSNQMM